jgi:hypothetical protein
MNKKWIYNPLKVKENQKITTVNDLFLYDLLIDL